jgi:hypothetical protein
MRSIDDFWIFAMCNKSGVLFGLLIRVRLSSLLEAVQIFSYLFQDSSDPNVLPYVTVLLVFMHRVSQSSSYSHLNINSLGKLLAPLNDPATWHDPSNYFTSTKFCFAALNNLDALEVLRLYYATMLDQIPEDIFCLVLREVRSCQNKAPGSRLNQPGSRHI